MIQLNEKIYLLTVNQISLKIVSKFGAEGKDSPALFFVFLSLLLLNFLGNYIMAWMKGGYDLLEQTTRQDRSYDESG